MIRYIPGNAQHIGARQDQQDAFGFSDPTNTEFGRHGGFLAVLADGMGGLEHGRVASSTAVRVFLAAYQQKTERESIPEALLRAAQDANTTVLELARQAGGGGTMGTTLVSAVLHGRELYWVSVGDSALYLVRDRSLTLLSASHTYAQELDQSAARGHISQEEALYHPERESLTSYVGIPVLDLIDANGKPLELEPGDRILLASDGLFKTLSLPEMAAAVTRNPQTFCDELVRRAMEKRRERQDNITVLCVGLDTEEAETLKIVGLPAQSRRTHLGLWLGAGTVALAAAGAISWRRRLLSAPVAAKGAAPAPIPGWTFTPAPEGDFSMGSGTGPDDMTHPVRMSAFEIGARPVSEDQWQAVSGPGGGQSASTPKTGVSYDDVRQFLERLNQRGDGYTYRLPTEAEWEFSRSKLQNQGEPECGLLQEWCQDWYAAGYYAQSPPSDPQGPPSGEDRVVRGGDDPSTPGLCSPTRRGHRNPATRDPNLGFRVVRVKQGLTQR